MREPRTRPGAPAGRRLASLLVLGAVVALTCTAPTAAAAPLRSSAFLTYARQGEETLANEGRHLERVSVFAYHVTRQGDVVPPVPWVPDVVDRLAADPQGKELFVVVNNRVLEPDGRPSPQHDGEVIFQILSDPELRAEHIRQIVGVVGEADGVELNYERLEPEIRDLFTRFVADLRAALPADKKLSLILQPKTTNAPGSNGRAVDWRALEPHADAMRIMAYYYSWSTSPPGPVVPLETLRAVARYALDDPEQSIPPEKLSIILSLWGWDWPMPEGTPGRLIDWDQAMALADEHGATPEPDPTEGSLRFAYTDDAGVEHRVWIDDGDSIRRRVELLEEEGMPSIDFWHLATGDPAVWEYVAERTDPCASAPPGALGCGPIDEPPLPSPDLDRCTLGAGFLRCLLEGLLGVRP